MIWLFYFVAIIGIVILLTMLANMLHTDNVWGHVHEWVNAADEPVVADLPTPKGDNIRRRLDAI